MTDHTTADVHQFHGTTCLCGFDSHGRSRSMTEHIVEAEREMIARAIEAEAVHIGADSRLLATRAAYTDAARIARSGGNDE